MSIRYFRIMTQGRYLSINLFSNIYLYLWLMCKQHHTRHRQLRHKLSLV